MESVSIWRGGQKASRKLVLSPPRPLHPLYAQNRKIDVVLSGSPYFKIKNLKKGGSLLLCCQRENYAASFVSPVPCLPIIPVRVLCPFSLSWPSRVSVLVSLSWPWRAGSACSCWWPCRSCVVCVCVVRRVHGGTCSRADAGALTKGWRDDCPSNQRDNPQATHKERG